MSKNILIASHALEIGGAESSLIGYLYELSTKEDVKCELFLNKHCGELMSYIPSGIKLLPESSKYACLATPIKKVIKEKQFLIALGRALGKINAILYTKRNKLDASKSNVGLEYSHKYTKAFLPDISTKEYDLAVSFLTPHYFVAEKVKAKKKIAYIHTDYSYVTIDTKSELKMWASFDMIAAVSTEVKNSFVNIFPSLEDKVIVIENVNPISLIKEKAESFTVRDEMPDSSCKILSIGRFCDAKNFESIPYKVQLLKNKGLRVKWYIIGYGNDSLIRKAIKETNTENDVVVLGKKENPYPYIKQCDIYAQPSRYEGKSVTVLEAQILAKPVIISNYKTASTQLKDGVDGVIAPIDDEGFVSVLERLIINKELRQELINNCNKTNYSNSNMADKLISLA